MSISGTNEATQSVPFGTGVVAVGTGASSAGTNGTPARVDHVHSVDPPACRLTDADAQSLTNNTLTDLIFNDVDVYDTNGMHDPASNPERITIVTTGLYLFTGHLTFATDTDITEVLLRILVDGTTDIGQTRVAGTLSGFQILNVSGVAKLTAGQYATLNARHVNTSAGANSVTIRSFTATWLGRG